MFNLARTRTLEFPRSIRVTRPMNSALETDASFRRMWSPRVTRTSSLEPAVLVTARWTISWPSRAKTTISPGKISLTLDGSTTIRSPGRIAGTMLMPDTLKQTRPKVRAASAARSQPSVFVVSTNRFRPTRPSDSRGRKPACHSPCHTRAPILQRPARSGTLEPRKASSDALDLAHAMIRCSSYILNSSGLL